LDTRSWLRMVHLCAGCWSEFIKNVGIAHPPCCVNLSQALDRYPSYAWAIKMPALVRAKNTVTVSIIALVLSARPACGRNDMQRRTVKRISFRETTIQSD
jgi:hypothetical protein